MANIPSHISRHQRISKWKSPRGFTLLEMLVVFTIIGLMTATGMASFFSFNRTQSFNTAVTEVESTLRLARSRAISRVKPPVCGANALRGYQVSLSGAIYRLRVACGTAGATHIIQSKNLPSNISFPTGVTVFVNFAVGTGVVSPAPQTITLNGYGKTASITVDSIGNISVQ